MSTNRLSLIRRAQIFSSLLTALFGLAAGPLLSASTSVPLPFSDQEMNDFLEAKGFIFDRAWVQAVNSFHAYFKTYPAGRYGDEAGYWLAKALDGQAGKERTIERVLDCKVEAVEALNRLEKGYPVSRWLEEARPFRKKLLSEIALLGGSRRRAFLAGFLKEEKKTLDQVRLDALDTLLSWDRGWAAPVIEDLIKTVADPAGRKSAVRFAARFFPDETESLLRDAAARDADAGVRAEAAAALERVEMERLPVNALYYIYTARLTDAAGWAKLPEMTAKVFDLAPASQLNNEEAERSADEVFRGKLRRLKLSNVGTTNFDLGERLSWVRDILEGLPGIRLDIGGRRRERVVGGDLSSEQLEERLDPDRLRRKIAQMGETGAVKILVSGDVTVVLPFAALQKTPESVSGQVVFELGGKAYPADFSVDSRRDQLAAFRRGDDVWLVVMMFDATDAERVRFPWLRRRSRPPVVFSDFLGCRVETSRESWPFEELTGGGLVDFGKGMVEIPDGGGRWRLEGFIQADKAKKTFIGRNAELYNPSGKLVVRAAEVVVPAGAPDKYQVVKK